MCNFLSNIAPPSRQAVQPEPRRPFLRRTPATGTSGLLRCLASVALLICSLACGSLAHAQQFSSCGPLENNYGPFDYRLEKGRRLNIVEGAHFTAPVEALIRGSSSDFVGDDLSYTLRTSPNHHRALIALMKFAERSKSTQPQRMQYSVDCYFERALRFQPNDTVVRSLFAQYLNRTGRRTEGLQQLNFAISQAKDNPFSHYNIGLVFMELEAYDEALAQAHTAIALGMPPGTLVAQLQKMGKWREPVAVEPTASAASASTGTAP